MKNGSNFMPADEARLKLPVICVIIIPTPKRNKEGYSSQNYEYLLAKKTMLSTNTKGSMQNKALVLFLAP